MKLVAVIPALKEQIGALESQLDNALGGRRPND